MYYGILPNVLMNKSANFMVLLVMLSGFTVSCSTSDIKPKQEQAQERPLQQQSSSESKNHPNGRQAKQSEKNSPTTRKTQQTSKASDDSKVADIKNSPTETEKGRQIEQKFDASLSQFDDMLLKKKPPLVMQQPASKALSSEGNPNARSGIGGNEENDNEGGSNTDISGSGQNMAGAVNEAIKYADDDIVARQIREAAENELDPQLKKKLWMEYNKYKSGN